MTSRRDGVVLLSLPADRWNNRVGFPAASHQTATASPVAFPGLSLQRQSALFGIDRVYPPDTQLAAGPDSLLEMVNVAGAIWSKTGSLIEAFDLNAFFAVDPGFRAADPRVIYDSVSGRWFASVLSFSVSGDSFVHLAVSQSSDPSAAWFLYYAGPFEGVIADQPKLGASNLHVAISWQDFAGSDFVGVETWIIQKSDLVSGADSPAVVAFGPDPFRFSLVPAINQGPTDTQYIVYNNAGLQRNTSYPSLGVIAITGTPTGGNVSWIESNPTVMPTAIPPPAEQPWGLPIDTADDRFLSAVWQNNVIWIGGNDRCTPTGDTAARSCLRLVQISTAGAVPTVVQDFDVAAQGAYLAYPAVAMDGAGSLFFVFSAVGPETYGSVLTSGQLVGSTTLVPSTLLKAGEGPYLGYQKSFGANRWGDYSGAAVDPSDPTQVWFAGEYAATSADIRNWGTEIGTISGAAPPDIEAPTISGVRDSPDPFSPNGDGRQDKVRIYWRVSEGAVETTTIRNSNGRIVYFFPGFVTRGLWYEVWNGRDTHGRRVSAGVYRYTIQAVDAAGNRSAVERGAVTVEL